MSDKLVKAIHKAAGDHAARARSEFIATVVGLNPLSVELHGVADVIDEDDGLSLTQWVKFYDRTGIKLGDTVLVSRRGDSWFVTDVESDTVVDNIGFSRLIVDADVSGSAAIAESKLALATDAAVGVGSRRTLGSGALQAMPGNRTLNAITAPAADVSMNSHKLTSVTPGTASTDAATVGQLIVFGFPGFNGLPNGDFETNTTGWAASGFGSLNAGATLSRVTTQSVIGSASMQVVTTTGAAFQGAAASATGTYRAGVSYWLSAYMKGNAGGEVVQLSGADNATGDFQATSNLTLTTGWRRYSLIYIPAADHTLFYMSVFTTTASAYTFFMDAALVTVA